METSLKRKSWGSKKDRDILAISFQVGTFFAWVNKEKKWILGDDFDFDAMFDWFVDIAPSPHSILEDFAAHLDDDHKKLPSTTKTYLISLRIFAKWFAAHRNVSVDTFKDEIKSLIESHGGKVSGSISAKTHFVVAGRDMGPAKLEKAKSLGIPIISEVDLDQMISQE